MKWRYILLSGILFLCAIVIYIVYPTDENRIRGIINKSVQAVVSEDIDKLMDFISYNYLDNYGNSYLKLKKTVQHAFKRLDKIDVEKNIRKIKVNDTLAEAELTVRVIASEGKERGYIIGDAVKAKTIKIFFEKSSYKWLIIKVEGVAEKYPMTRF